MSYNTVTQLFKLFVSRAKIIFRVLDNVKNRVFNISILSKPLIYAMANGCELRSMRIFPSIMHFHKDYDLKISWNWNIQEFLNRIKNVTNKTLVL